MVESGVIVHSVGISDGSDSKVDKLADLTHGFKAKFSEDGKSNALDEAFSALANMGITGNIQTQICNCKRVQQHAHRTKQVLKTCNSTFKPSDELKYM